MSASRRGSGRQSAPLVSKYAEVDSDVDMDDEAKEISKAKADARWRSVYGVDSDSFEIASSDGYSGYAAGPSTAAKPAAEKAIAISSNDSLSDIDSDIDDMDSELQLSDAESSSSKTEQVKPEQKAPAPLEHFLKMPLDILAEICSHLPVETLIELCRTSKIFRSVLLSRAGRSIWSAARLRIGLPTLKYHELDEVQYAILLFGSDNCHFCQSKSSSPYRSNRRLDDMLIACDACYEAHTLTISRQKTRWPHFHPEAPSCVYTKQHDVWTDIFGHFTPYPGMVTYVRQDLERVSDKLRELEAADAQETREREILQLRDQGNINRRAEQQVSEEWDLSQPHTSRVDRFVEECKQSIANQRDERDVIIEAFSDYQLRVAIKRQEAAKRELEMQSAAKEKRDAELRTRGWTAPHINLLSSLHWHDQIQGLPCPTVDYDNWKTIKTALDNEFKQRKQDERDEKARRALSKRQNARKSFVQGKYTLLRSAQPKNEVVKFPSFGTFLDLDSVRPFWEPDPKGDDDSDEEESSDDDHEDDDEDLEDVKPSTTRASRSLGKAVSKRVKASPKQNSSKIETEDPRERKWERKWERKMSTIKADVEAHIDDNRVWVIKQIISATTDEDIADLSENAQDYDEQTYGTDFFKTITSHFILKRGETGRRTSWTHDKKYVAVPYPDVLKDTPVPSTSALRVRIIRAILDVGELDEDTATVEDLDALGHLCWLDWVGPKREKALWTWTELVYEMSARPHLVKKSIRICLAKDLPKKNVTTKKPKSKRRKLDDDDWC